MKQFLLTMAGVFAGLVLFLVGVPFLLLIMAANASRPDAVPAHAVLSLDLREPLKDQEPSNPLAAFGRPSLSVMHIISTLRKAETDDRVKSLLIRLPEGGIEPAAADEIRLAIKHFRASGKTVLAHSQGLYPSGMITSTYMLGASADSLWMQPGASFQVTGLANEDIFFKRFFDKYGVKANYEQRYEFKNAVNGYLFDDYTPAHRQAELSWLSSIYRGAIAHAATDRKLPVQTLTASLEAGPYMAEDAQRLRLVDKVGQVHDAQAFALKAAGAGSDLIDLRDYAQSAPNNQPASGPIIAIVEAEGPIVTGQDSGGSPFSGGSTIYSDTISKAIYDATANGEVKAIVLRVNSPGGSDTASEQILAAVRAAKAAKKPVVVSMGTYAASGGYWISSEASAIVAQPSTLTGSIGVFGGKFAIGEALAKFGVDIRQIGVGGAYAGSFGASREFSAADRAAFAKWMDQIYGNFITRVSVGRNLPEARVREIAKGRVWTGIQAKELGLVDEIGGFYQAVDKAKALAGITGEARLRTMHTQVSPIEAIQNALGVSTSSVRMLAAAAWVLGDPRAQGVIDQMAKSRLGVQGTNVMAETPLH
jgi:protease IV